MYKLVKHFFTIVLADFPKSFGKQTIQILPVYVSLFRVLFYKPVVFKMKALFIRAIFKLFLKEIKTVIFKQPVRKKKSIVRRVNLLIVGR